MSRLLSFAFVVIAILAISAPSYGQISVWKDDDPATSGVSGFSGFLSVSPIADPTGDAARTTVGEVSTSATTAQWSNMAPSPSAPQPVPAGFIGKTYSFTIDYYVPSSSSMQNDLTQSFYLVLTFRDAADAEVEKTNAGFIKYDTATLDTWQTIEITGEVPAGSDEVVPLLVFNNGGTAQPGTAAYFDNVDFTVDGVAIQDNPLWVDDDPATAGVSGTSGGVMISQIPDPTGDAARVTVGEIDHSLSTGQWTNIRSEPNAVVAIDPSLVGEPYSFTVDYYVPSTGTMSINTTQSIYISLKFRDSAGADIENNNNGFINYTNAQLDTWQTLSITGVVPAGTVQAVPLLLTNNQNALTAGAAYYADNINFSVQTIVDVNTAPLKGDVDMDGDVDFADIPPFIAVLQGGGFQAEADCDCSTVVDFADIPAFIMILQNQ